MLERNPSLEPARKSAVPIEVSGTALVL